MTTPYPTATSVDFPIEGDKARRPTFELCVNARFRAQPITGVQRYAIEVLQRLPYSHREICSEKWQTGIRGHCWEQWQLSKRRPKQSVLWSPCNTGPLAATRHVVTIHDLAFIDRPQDFSAAFASWYRWLIPRLASRCAAILTVSEYSKHRICAELNVDQRKVHVAPNGVTRQFCPASDEETEATRQKLKLPPTYVVALGSLGPRKNLAVLFEAWKILARKLPNTKLVVVGEQHPIFRPTSAEAPQDSSVSFVGRLPDADLPPLLSGASAFVFPSVYEGFGLPPLEAMACGCPVLTSNATSVPEVVGDAALLFDPYDSDSLARQLFTVLSDADLRCDLSQRGVERSSEFTWEKTATEVYRVFDRVANE